MIDTRTEDREAEALEDMQDKLHSGLLEEQT